MPIVEGLVVAHVSATALLLLVFVLTVLCQRLTRALQQAPDLAARPASIPPVGAVPQQAAGPVEAPTAVPSVVDRTIDPRDRREAGVQLQTS